MQGASARRLGWIICLFLGASAVHLAHAAAPPTSAPAPHATPAAPGAQGAPKSPAAEYIPDIRFRLRTARAEGKLVFVGVGGEIDGVVNPTLRVAEGAVVQVDLINDDGIEHDVVFPEFDAATERISQRGASSVTVFRAVKPGIFAYFCSLPGHRPAGTVRIFFGVGGPNYTSSFHVIGEIFDRVYQQAALTAPPATDMQTTLVPAGGAAVVEFTLEVPGRYILVDHALARVERGLVGFLVVQGAENLEVFRSGPAK
jgi:FtsP/CotA-like multicopper oxidase with cupredoxin domain